MATSLKRFTVFTSPAGRNKPPIVHASSADNVGETFCGLSTELMDKEPGDKWYQCPPPTLSCKTCRNQIKKVWPVRGAFYRWDK